MRNELTLLAAILLSGCAASHPIEPQLAAASVDFAGAERVEVRLENFSFTPSELHLQPGRAYALVLNNGASGGHDFAAPEFFAAAKVAPQDADLVRSGEVDLRAGQSATIHIVPAAGHYGLVCTHLGHAVLGMKGSIDVS